MDGGGAIYSSDFVGYFFLKGCATDFYTSFKTKSKNN